MKNLRFRIERVLSLIRHQQTVEHIFRHAHLQFDRLHCTTQRCLRTNGNVQFTLFTRLEHQIVSNVNRNGNNTLGSYVVRHQSEITVRRNERQHSFRFPSFETNARMKGHIVEQSWIHKRKRQIGHSAKFDAAVNLSMANPLIWLGIRKQCRPYVSLNLSKHSLSVLIDDGVHFFDNIEIGFVVCILNGTSSPRYCAQLTRRQCSTYAGNNRVFMSHELTVHSKILSSHFDTYFDLPVTVFAIVRSMFGGLINSFRMLLSVANGKPLSSISSNSS